MVDASAQTAGRVTGGLPHVFLHIGTMKSGTSYIQHVLRRNRTALEAAGLLVPRQRLVPAVADVLNRKAKKASRDHRGTWDIVRREIERWHGGPVILSQEFMSAADEAAARRIVASFEPRRVSVIITARDLVRVIPSHWQTSVKQAKIVSLGEFVRVVQDESADPMPKLARGFWKHHDLARLIGIWGNVVGTDHITVVTVPPSGAPPVLLWERFASVIGVDPAMYDATADQTANFTLSYTAAELLRRVNERLGDSISPVDHRRVVNGFVANTVLRDDSHERAASDRARLSPVTHAWAVQRGARMVAAVAASGVKVVGDLEDLLAEPPTGDPTDTTEPGPLEESPDAAVTVIVALVQRLVKAELALGPEGPDVGAREDAGPASATPPPVPAGPRPSPQIRRRRADGGQSSMPDLDLVDEDD